MGLSEIIRMQEKVHLALRREEIQGAPEVQEFLSFLEIQAF